MTLDEAINHCKEVAYANRNMSILGYNSNGVLVCKDKDECIRCAKEHEQLAKWLEELKAHREGKLTCENCKHKNKGDYEYPCTICRCSHPNKFEWESEDKK